MMMYLRSIALPRGAGLATVALCCGCTRRLFHVTGGTGVERLDSFLNAGWGIISRFFVCLPNATFLFITLWCLRSSLILVVILHFSFVFYSFN